MHTCIHGMVHSFAFVSSHFYALDLPTNLLLSALLFATNLLLDTTMLSLRGMAPQPLPCLAHPCSLISPPLVLTRVALIALCVDVVTTQSPRVPYQVSLDRAILRHVRVASIGHCQAPLTPPPSAMPPASRHQRLPPGWCESRPAISCLYHTLDS